jgi:hypothetical protein
VALPPGAVVVQEEPEAAVKPERSSPQVAEEVAAMREEAEMALAAMVHPHLEPRQAATADAPTEVEEVAEAVSSGARPEAAGVAPADVRSEAVAVERAAQPAEEVVAERDAQPEVVAAAEAEVLVDAPPAVAVEAAALPREAARADAVVVVLRQVVAAEPALRLAAQRPLAAASRLSFADRVAGSARRRTCLDQRRHLPASPFAPATALSRSPSLPAGQHQFASSEVSPVFKPMNFSRVRKIDWRQIIPSRSSIKV